MHQFQTSVSQIKYTDLIITSVNVDRFTKFFHCQITEEILCTNIIKILHLTLSVILHYLVKLENHNCCQYQWHVACETSEFMLQDMRLPK